MNVNQLVDSAYDAFNNKKYRDSLQVLLNIDKVLEEEKYLNKKKKQFVLVYLILKGFNFLGLNKFRKSY